MREELMKKFAEDDRLEQVSEHKRRMKAPETSDGLRGGLELGKHMGKVKGKLRRLRWEITKKKWKRREKMVKIGNNWKRCGLFPVAKGDLKWKHCHL